MPIVNNLFFLRHLVFRRCIATQAAAHLLPGTVVEHRLGGTPTLMLLTQRLGGGRTWVAMDAQGMQHIVRPQQVFTPIPSTTPFTIDDLQTIEAQGAAVDRQAVYSVWQRLAPQGDNPAQLLDLSTLATAIVGDNTALACYGVYRALLNNTSYFQLAKRHPRVLFRPRRRDDHQHRTAQDDEREAMQATADAVRALLAARESQDDAPLTDTIKHDEQLLPLREAHPLLQGPSPVAHALRCLWRFAAEPTHDVPSATTAMALLHALHMLPTPHAGANVLRALGVLHPHDPVPLFRAGVRATFPPHVEAAVDAALARPDPLSDIRRDLTHQRVFVIDDPCTTEVDDGVAWEHGVLYVHVADPVRLLSLDSPIVTEAVARTRTVYLPGERGKFCMMPPRLSEGPGSLQRTGVSCAITVAINVADDASLASWEVFPSRVAPRDFMSYEASTEALAAGDPALQAMMDIARRRAAKRRADGALDLQRAEYTWRGNRPAAIDYETLPTRRLIEEAMILANEAIAREGIRLGLALPYRAQHAPAVDVRPDMTPAEQVDVVLPHLRAATVSSCPAPHAGLGLDAYVQTTSPLRRVADLLVHMQLHAVFLGQPPPFSAPKLDAVLDGVMATHRALVSAEMEVEQAYLAAFFAQQPPEATYEAVVTVAKWSERGVLRVLLRQFGVAVHARVTTPCVRGDVVRLQVAGADPDIPLLRFVQVVEESSSNT